MSPESAVPMLPEGSEYPKGSPYFCLEENEEHLLTTHRQGSDEERLQLRPGNRKPGWSQTQSIEEQGGR